MSTTTKKASTKGVRYTDAQKKEVVDFAVAYNSTHGRGGQSKAAEKFGISQLTISTWLKKSGAPASKSAKVAKAPKAAKAAKPAAGKASKSRKGPRKSRYTDDQKKEVTDFVASYNSANGRGGASKAAAKYKVSPLTVTSWLKAAGVTGPSRKGSRKTTAAPAKGQKGSKVSAPTPLSGGYGARLGSLVALGNQIDKAEADLAQLKAKFNSLKSSL